MTWTPVTEIRPSPGGPAFPSLADPYAEWAALTDFKRYWPAEHIGSPEVGETWVAFVGRARDAAVIGALAADRSVRIPAFFLRPVPGSTARATCFTGRIRRAELHRLQTWPGLERWELGLPVAVPDSAPANYKRRKPPLVDESGPRNVIAVLDYGCAWLNAAFRDSGLDRTRLSHLWWQDRLRKGTQDPGHAGHGSVYDASFINGRIARLATHDELELYAQEGYLPLHLRADAGNPQRRTSHGTHVLDVAGGRIDPWTGADDDAAASASLMFVELPFLTVADGSGGGLALHLLDGIREVLAASAADAKIVIVVSQGTHAGPHDGSSLFEEAIDELLALRPHDFCIVIGAGNARLQACRAEARVAPGQTVELTIDVPAQDETDTFVECWYPRVEAGIGTDLTFEAVTPWGDTVAVQANAAAALYQTLPEPAALLTHRASNALGGDAMALLALAPAIPVDGQGTQGLWRLRVHNRGNQVVQVDAYVERDEPVKAPRRGFPQFVAAAPSRAGVEAVGWCETGTLSTLATPRRAIVVGACERRTMTRARYSSLGDSRDRRPLPAALAPADESALRQGVRAATVRSGFQFRMQGTSVAAPALARLLYNELAAAPAPVGRAEWQAIIDGLRAAGKIA